MTNTQNIQKFLRPPDRGGAYTDEKLAALLAHAEDGKLAYDSCCCFIGVPNALHALRTCRDVDHTNSVSEHAPIRLGVNMTPQMRVAEREFCRLGNTDALRRERLIPLIHAEMALREQEREAMTKQTFACPVSWCSFVGDQEAQEQHQIEEHIEVEYSDERPEIAVYRDKGNFQ